MLLLFHMHHRRSHHVTLFILLFLEGWISVSFLFHSLSHFSSPFQTNSRLMLLRDYCPLGQGVFVLTSFCSQSAQQVSVQQTERNGETLHFKHYQPLMTFIWSDRKCVPLKDRWLGYYEPQLEQGKLYFDIWQPVIVKSKLQIDQIARVESPAVKFQALSSSGRTTLAGTRPKLILLTQSQKY